MRAMTRSADSPSWSLARRLLVTTLSMVMAVWLMTGALLWWWEQHELNELLDAHLAQTAALISTSDLEDEKPGQVPAHAPTLIRRHQLRVAFQIWRDGQLVMRSESAPEQPLAAAGVAGLSNHHSGGGEWRVFTVVRRGADQRDYAIHVAERLSARHDVLLATLGGVAVPLLLALPLLAWGIWWSVRRTMAPVHRLVSAVTQHQAHALQALPLNGLPQEVRPLVQALNELFERVSEQMHSERRFTADAAHELRTPIAAIRIQAQVAQGASAEPERVQALADTIAGCDRAAHLVEQLLQLARLEAETTDADRAPDTATWVDLVAAVDERVCELRPAARAHEQTLDWQAPMQPVPVRMAPTLAAVLLRNLMDNALRYSPPGARVQVGLLSASSATGPQLVVQDSGPGLTDEAMGRLGERFFRVLGSGQSGSGLGWSIVRRLARLYGLTTQVDRSKELGGLRVRVTWPLEVPDGVVQD